MGDHRALVAEDGQHPGPEEPRWVHAEEAGGHYQQPVESHQVLTSGHWTLQPKRPFSVQNCINRVLIFNIIIIFNI